MPKALMKAIPPAAAAPVRIIVGIDQNGESLDAVIAALEADLGAVAEPRPLNLRVADIAAELRAMANPGGRDMTKAEIDAMWGQP